MLIVPNILVFVCTTLSHRDVFPILRGPIKLVFPRFHGASAGDMSMLGLGDIVIPGLFVALMLRYDVRNLPLGEMLPSGLSSRVPYFRAVMVAYVAGLVATIVAMNVFSAAQPALLYLVPACLLTVLITATVKGELAELWAYTEEDEENKGEKTKEGKDVVTKEDKKEQ
jgi:minor histocompatibility antigen H13